MSRKRKNPDRLTKPAQKQTLPNQGNNHIAYGTILSCDGQSGEIRLSSGELAGKKVKFLVGHQTGVLLYQGKAILMGSIAGTSNTKPKVGDRVVFQQHQPYNNPAAHAWAYAQDYNQALGREDT